jgi:uncharacterized protein with NRDE domain
MSSDPRVAVVWQLAQKNLADQVASIDELRGRVSTLLAAWSVATGFLASQALNGGDLEAGSWLGIVSSALLIAMCGIILAPRQWKGQSVDVATLLSNIDGMPAESMSDFERRMAMYAKTNFDENKFNLEWLHRAFGVALLALCGDFAGWIWALASR